MTIPLMVRRVAVLSAGVAIAALWWLFFAPTCIGGSATYAVVAGQSMLPRLEPGDLVIARRSALYRPGDLVVYRLDRGYVVHELVRKVPGGWRAKGRHNRSSDPRVVADSAILGKHILTVPGFGALVAWAAGHPLPFGGLTAAMSVLLVPWPRRRNWGQIPLPKLNGVGRSLLMGSSASAVVSLLVTVGSARAGRLRSPLGITAAAGLALAGAVSLGMLRAWRNGIGLPDPLRARCAMGHRLRAVDELPAVRSIVWVRSPGDLRRRADRRRRAVLHRIGPWGDEFMVVVGDRAYACAVPRGGSALPLGIWAS